MEVKHWDGIVAFKQDSHTMALHTRDLEVAEIDPSVWEAFDSSDANSEAFQELLAWNNQEESSTEQKVDQNSQALMINVTQLCNLHCDYCAAGGDGTYGNPVTKIDLSSTYKQIEKFSAPLNSDGTFHIVFFGGEPLLYPETIRSLAQYAKSLSYEKGFSVQFRIISNGTMAQPKVLETLRAVSPVLEISIDGPAEINDKQRKDKAGKGVTAKILQNLQTFSAMRQQLKGLELNAVFDPSHTDVLATWEMFHKLPVDSFNFEYSLTDTNEETSQAFVDSLQKVAKRAYDLGGTEELLRIKQFAAHFARLDSRVKNVNFCNAGKTFFSIDSQNNIYSCPWDANDLKESLGRGQTILPEKKVFYENQIVNKTDCHSCWAKYLCGGGCMYSHKSDTGLKSQVNSSFCNRTRSLWALSILWYLKSQSRPGGH